MKLKCRVYFFFIVLILLFVSLFTNGECSVKAEVIGNVRNTDKAFIGRTPVYLGLALCSGLVEDLTENIWCFIGWKKKKKFVKNMKNTCLHIRRHEASFGISPPALGDVLDWGPKSQNILIGFFFLMGKKKKRKAAFLVLLGRLVVYGSVLCNDS